jgi:hypothetical protein
VGLGLFWVGVKDKRTVWVPVVLMGLFALSRWPGLLPPNFSAAYGLAFCAGVYFSGKLAWWLPLGALAVSDVAINLYYWLHDGINAFQPVMLVNYAAFALIIGLGRQCKPQDSWLKLLGGGLLGAVLFYLITNTAAWFFNPFGNPEYTRDLVGWIIALTTGTKAGWLQTWEMFRNTLLSGGLFTGLFVGAMKLSEQVESALDKEPVAEPAQAPEEAQTPEPEEAKA